MRAILIDKFVENIGSLRISNVPDPIPKADNEVLINITHAGLNHVDLLYGCGKHQNNRFLVTPPFVLGLEFAGIVASSSPTSKFNTGDRVLGSGVGGLAEKIVVKENELHQVPTGWKLEEAAGITATAPVSYGALVRVADVKKDETVLVHAATGGLGVMAVQIAKGLGAKVIGTVGSEAKETIARDIGVDHIVRYDRDDWEKEVLRITCGQGVDVVFDSVGLVEKSIRCLKFAGRVIIIGFAGLDGKMEKMAMNRILLKSAKVCGYRYGETVRQFPGEHDIIWQGVDSMLDRGLIKPVIYDTRYEGLDSVPHALEDLAARKIWGKAIVRIDPQMKTLKL